MNVVDSLDMDYLVIVSCHGSFFHAHCKHPCAVHTSIIGQKLVTVSDYDNNDCSSVHSRGVCSSVAVTAVLS